MRHSPPRLAERFLSATIRDSEWRDSVVGDLREEFAGLVRRSGVAPARRWYWRQALSIAAHALSPRASRRRIGAWGVLEPTPDRALGVAIGHDLLYAWRAVVRQAGTSMLIVVTLALVLAANSVAFGVMDAVALRPFRFADVDRLVMIASHDPQDPLIHRWSVAPADLQDWQREARTLTDFSASLWWDASLSGIDIPEQVAAYRVTAGYFETFGLSPLVGRSFVPDDERPGNHRRVILGHALWTRLYGADPQIVGRTIRLDGEPYEVIGVAPARFAIPLGAEIWAPLAYSAEEWNSRAAGNLMVVARLTGDATIAHARTDIGDIVERQRRAFPETNGRRPNMVVPFISAMRDPGTPAFTALMLGASLFLLLIACANIANLLLAGGAERAQEFAMRLALGSSRRRLAGQLVMEASLLTTAAIVLALPLAWAGLEVSRASVPPGIIRFIAGWDYLEVSPVLFAVTTAFGAAATFGFALLPALQAARNAPADTLRAGRAATAGRHRQWLRSALAGAQVAITVTLLFGSALLMTGLQTAMSGTVGNGTLGFDKRNVLVGRLVLPQRPYADADARRRFASAVLERLRTIPAASQASATNHIPYGSATWIRPFYPDTAPAPDDELRQVAYRLITPEYLETMRIPVLAGRTFTDADRRGTPQVALVSRSAVDRYWPNVDPIGRTFRLSPDGEPITIVGVTGNVLHDWYLQQRGPEVYRPIAQEAPFALAFAIRTVGDPTALAGDLRRAVSAADPNQPLLAVQSLESLIAERTAGLRFIASMTMTVAGVALVLALMGVYGVIAFVVSRRTHELGVRMALGATRRQLVMLTTSQGVRITLAGVVVGTAGALGVGQLLNGMFAGLVASSTVLLASVSVAMAALALLASYVPGRRTANVDPMVALRDE